MRINENRGYTLLEMVIVVAILATVAAIAVPSDSPRQHYDLHVAASHLADALRFARVESQRTSVVHGVSVSTTNNNARVFRLDEASNPNIPIFDVYHPVTKQLYSLNFSTLPFRNVSVTAVDGQMQGTCTDSASIAFDSSGVVRCIEPTATRIRAASVQVNSGAISSTVTIDEYTGRVVLQ